MWIRMGHTVDGVMGATLHAITSDSGEGDGYDVVRGGNTIGRVQEYTATIEVGKGLTTHGAAWAFTPTTGGAGRWAKTAGQTVFGFVDRDDAVRHAVSYHT